MLLGFIGGIFGAIFTIINLKINRARRYLVSRIRKPTVQKVVRFAEPIFIMVSEPCQARLYGRDVGKRVIVVCQETHLFGVTESEVMAVIVSRNGTLCL